MAIKVQGTTVVDDSRNILNVVDANVTGVSTFQGNVNVGTGATVAFFDVSSGNIGINSTSPTVKLDVNGSVAIGGSVYDNNNSPGTNGQVLSNVTGFGVSWTDAAAGGGGGGAGGKWIDAGVGIVTTSSIGVNTTTVVGTANSEGAIQVVGNVALVDGALLTDQNIDANVYIPSGKNGLMIGPTTVGVGVTIDIASGSTLVVV